MVDEKYVFKTPKSLLFFTPELLTDFPVCVRHLTQCLAPWEVGWKGPWCCSPVLPHIALCLSHQMSHRSCIPVHCHQDVSPRWNQRQLFWLGVRLCLGILAPPRRIVKGKALQVSPDVTTSVKEWRLCQCQSQVVTHTSSLVVGGPGTWSPRYLGHGGFPSPAWVSPLHPPPPDLSPCESRCVAFKKQCQVVFDTAGQFTKSPNKGFPVW